MARRDDPYPAKGPIVWAVILGLFALGVVPQLGTTRTGVEYLLFLAAAVGAVALATKAVRDRR